MVVRDRDGVLLDVPEPVDLAGLRVAGTLLPDDIGVPPASLLEAVEASASSSA
jgi:hypothetical protein